MRTGMIDKRNCFLMDSIQDVEVSIPLLDKNDNVIYDSGDIVTCDIDRLCEEFIPIITDRYKETSCLQAVQRCFKKVCPKSMSNHELDLLINMETFARDYHIPPLGQEYGFEDYPAKVVNAFIVISGTREVFKEEDLKQKQEDANRKAIQQQNKKTSR